MVPCTVRAYVLLLGSVEHNPGVLIMHPCSLSCFACCTWAAPCRMCLGRFYGTVHPHALLQVPESVKCGPSIQLCILTVTAVLASRVLAEFCRTIRELTSAPLAAYVLSQVLGLEEFVYGVSLCGSPARHLGCGPTELRWTPSPTLS